MPKRPNNLRSLASARAKRAAKTEVMEPGDIGNLFGSSGDPTSTRHTHVLMRAAPDGRSWAFDSTQAREAARILTAYAGWLDGPQQEVET